ncbi:peptide ligase PGM1-related protein [Streptomyces sp. NBC_00859]|uniref:preATP grasp domain-containing protein n=1 Tax=Streptomyces sp. NBC_00859 TaxID=2903682 RepID=UPI0038704F78|nr:peptide ligase PGM1-related protein [Streptomyces sp. NBC_00859]WSZ86787.1 peptide ligase PGM1-related protein [Streptomyces sp. NBC_00859]
MQRPYPLLVFGNFVNELMVTVPVHRHADALVAVSPRKVWLTQPGDVLVTPRAMSEPLRDYACDLLGFSATDVTFLHAPTDGLATLTEAVRRNGLVDRLRSEAQQRPGIRFQAFAQDRPAIELAAEIGVPVEGYPVEGVPATAVAAAYRINTKPGFRELAGKLGIRVPHGFSCGTPAELAAALRDVLTDKGAAVTKLARGSNGYGVAFWEAGDLPDLDAKLAAYLLSVADQPPGWVVEERLDFVRIVTVEMEVDENGPRVMHVGEMRTPNGSFSGQITPLVASTSAVKELVEGGLALGRHLHQVGYWGPFDVDGGITADDVLYSTESNLRKTGCTYLDLLVKRLLGEERAADAVWIADSRVGGVEREFAAGVARVRQAGLSFETGSDEGVVITSDTLAFDGKWRYLILGKSHRRVEELESGLVDALKLS